MVNFREDSAFILKYICWGLVIIGSLVVFSRSCVAWGGFTEPFDIHFHPEPPTYCIWDSEKKLQELMDKEYNDNKYDQRDAHEKSEEA